MNADEFLSLRPTDQTSASYLKSLHLIAAEIASLTSKFEAETERRAPLLLRGTAADIRALETGLADIQINIEQLIALHHAIKTALPDLIKAETATKLRAQVAEAESQCRAAEALTRKIYEPAARQIATALEALTGAGATLEECHRELRNNAEICKEFAITAPRAVDIMPAGNFFHLSHAITHLPGLAPIDGEKPFWAYVSIWPPAVEPPPPYVPPPPRVFPPRKDVNGSYTIRQPGTPVPARRQ